MSLKEFFQKLFGYTSKRVRCEKCGNIWTAVYPVIREKYQNCPKCGSKNWHEVKK